MVAHTTVKALRVLTLRQAAEIPLRAARTQRLRTLRLLAADRLEEGVRRVAVAEVEAGRDRTATKPQVSIQVNSKMKKDLFFGAGLFVYESFKNFFTIFA